MKIYVSRITADHWCAKNNLEKEAHQLAKEMERRIVLENQLPDFRKELFDKMNALQAKYPRCKKLELSMRKAYDDKGDISIWCDGVFHMELFLTKGEPTSSGITLLICPESAGCDRLFNDLCPDNVLCPLHKLYRATVKINQKF